MNKKFYGWQLLAVMCVIHAFAMGFPAYAGSIMNTYMMAELSLDRKSLGLATASFGLCMGLFSPLSGYCVHRWGPRAMLSAGTLMMALGALALATTVSTLLGVLITYRLFMGCAGAMSGGVPTSTVTSHWFRKRLALALTILTAGASMGGFVATPLLARVIMASNENWRMGWWVVAGVCTVAFICAILLVRNKPADIGQVQDGPAADTRSDTRTEGPKASSVYRTTEDWSFREVVRHPGFWLMIFGVVCATSATGMMFGHGVVHFRDLGHSPAMAAMFLSTLIFAGLGGKGIFALLGDRMEPRYLWGAGLILAAMGMTLVVNATSTVALYASAILLGAGPAIGTPSMFTLLANYYGKDPYAQLMGATGLFLTLASSTVSVLAGIVFDHSGSYAWAFYPAAAVFLLCGLVMSFVPPPVRKLAQP